MKQIIIQVHEDELRLLYVKDRGEQIDYGELTDEPILQDINSILDWLNDLKSPEEQKIKELDDARLVALSYVQSHASDEEKLEMIDLFDEYKIGHGYIKGDEFKWQGSIYRVVNDHTSQMDWKPDEAVSLYVDILNKLTIEEFKQPTGSHDAYMIGDKVMWQGEVFRSIIDNNVWSPTDYPQGWEKEN